MNLTEAQLRSIVRSEIKSLKEDGPKPAVGKDIKGSVASKTASEKIEASPAVKKALDQITSADGLASFLQSVIKLAAEKGIDQNEIKTALKKVASAVMSAK